MFARENACSWPHGHKGDVHTVMDHLCRWYEEGKIRPHISHRFPLERFQEAMTSVLEGRSIGRVALVKG